MIIVVSGGSGAGKTTLSRILCASGSFGYCNVGDALLARLERAGFTAPSRERIGPLFLDEFGIDQYLDVLDDCAASERVLDGVRLSVGIAHLRRSADSLAHIFRESPPGGPAPPSYHEDMGLLRADADHVVPWYAALRSLEEDGLRLARRYG